MDPLNCEFMVAVLTRIDAELGVHNTAAEQQQFFENLLASQPLYFSTVKAVSARGPNDMKLLDADSCLAKPKRLIRDRMEAGNYATRIARVFAEGSACFPLTFLTAIEYTRNAEESSSA
ncbi:hypothetical protein CLAFUW4_14114 [Fulvia fulva]|uniref:Uncharacterized protein n=1 Tax=Passalora fulva TaxID=5499 RepID=A0A9Q8PKP3_PASFU|nr:uncharacterized protein CLAFUR5_13949 [Fulvia fulva]KAK4610348.1 hypothetical protein CLAFUR4_14117 [Fulvia fulva]KAK4611022.1 hypothetical protein CLAFUR0_14121 [Fulvia fulva]UJO24200.1 hypothetical protein CLAFUR5_13949 [Fulvia fulva]WPV21875.1 hypothetical protein CLAFUW4_14114 [Fulvia fulva]WPV37337.1 hypothetical protein CLAFUW7_14125 [Fulvia fulva]